MTAVFIMLGFFILVGFLIKTILDFKIKTKEKDVKKMVLLLVVLLVNSSCGLIDQLQIGTESDYGQVRKDYSEKLLSSPDCHPFFEKRKGKTFCFVKCGNSQERFGEFHCGIYDKEKK